MNLICFPHYTCGGLLCDIFSNTFSSVGHNGGINSFAHNIGKIGDSDSVFTEFDPETFNSIIQSLEVDQHSWIGTHCWPGNVNLESFDKVLCVTTTTARSKIYRWIRAYYLYYTNSKPWIEKSGQARIDKERETAKNYLTPFLPVLDKTNVINIEFSEIVETSAEFTEMVKGFDFCPHIDRWKNLNDFLYDLNIWNSVPFARFYEAEYETQLKKSYLYE
jgi:hypothetical protein